MNHYIKTKFNGNKKRKQAKKDDLWGLIGATALAVALFGGMIYFIIMMLVTAP